MIVTGIPPFNHLKCINWCLILLAVRISSVTLLKKTAKCNGESGIADKC